MKVVLLLMVVLISSCAPKGFKAASKGIQDSYGKKTAKSQWVHQLRMQLYASGKLPAITEPSDTLYFMHTSNIQTGAYRARIWNRQAEYTYLFVVNGKLHEDKSGYFSDVMMEVVRQGDQKQMQAMNHSSARTFHEQSLTAYRIIFNHLHPTVECFVFRNYDLMGR